MLHDDAAFWLNWTCSNPPQHCRACYNSQPEDIDEPTFPQSKRHLLAKEYQRYVTNGKTPDTSLLAALIQL